MRSAAAGMGLLFFATAPSAVAQERPFDLILALDTSPGTEQSIGLLNRRAFELRDRVGVVSISGANVRLSQPLTENREILASALQKAGSRVGIGFGGAQISFKGSIDIATTLDKACKEIDQNGQHKNRAILLLFGTEDPGLESHLSGLGSLLKTTGTHLYVVAINRDANQQTRRSTMSVPTLPRFPGLTAQLMSDLAKRSGGQIYRGAWDLRDIVKDIRKQEAVPSTKGGPQGYGEKR